MDIRAIYNGRFRRLWTTLAAAPILAGLASPAQGQTWSNGAGGAFETGTNWVGGVAPASSLTASLVFSDPAILGSSFTATNNTAAFTLNSMVFNNTGASTVTIAGSAANSINFAGTTPFLTVSSSGSAIFTAPVNILAPAVPTNADYSVRINMNGTGGLRFNGAIGGSTTNGTGANADVGFSSFGTGTGVLAFAGGGTTGFLRLNNTNVLFDGGTYSVLAAGNDTPSTAVPMPPASSPLIFAQNAGDNVTAIIRNGTIINSFDNAYFGNLAGSISNTTLTGAGTQLNLGFGNPAAVSGRFGPGNKGVGNFTVSAGAQVNAFFVFQSRLSGSSSIMVVDGVGSRVFSRTQLAPAIGNSGQFSIGNQSTGTWTVQNGGSSIGRNFLIGQTALDTVADTGLGDGTLNVIGAGSVVIAGGPLAATNVGDLVPGFMTIAAAGNGRLNISAGGVVNVNTDGGAVPAGGGFTMASGSALNTTQTSRTDVDGANSQLNVAGQFASGTTVSSGVSTVNITNGGLIAIGGTAFLTPAAVGTTGNTLFTVGGTNSRLTVAGQFQLSSNGGTAGGPSTLTLNSGGSIVVGGNAIFGALATTTINTGATLSAGGISSTTAVSFGNITNNGVLNVTLGGATYPGTISGSGTVTLTTSVTGSQTFTGPHTYSGTTTINAGTLFVNNTAGSGTGTGAVVINIGGNLAGTGSLTGAVSVTPGARIVGGQGTAVGESLTVGSATFDGTSILRVAVAEGGGTADTTPTGASRLAITGALDVTLGLLQGTSGRLNIELALTGTFATLNVPYQRTVGTYGTIGGTLGLAGPLPINIDPGDPQVAINPIGFQIDQSNWVLTINNNSMILTFTPVPEPASLLLIAGAGGLFVRRLRNRRQA